MDLVAQQYWDESYKNFEFYVAKDDLTQWLNLQLQQQSLAGKTVFEVGCFPGRYLAWFGQQGAVVSGMDLAPQMSLMDNWFQSAGFSKQLIQQGDVLEYLGNSADRYDIVCSFGFIEHFRNFEHIIQLHTGLVARGGRLVITTPNFRGRVQYLLHKYLDKENLDRHYTPSMQPEIWAGILRKNGYRIDWSGHFGHFDFWADKQKRNFLQKLLAKVCTTLPRYLKWLPNSRHYSPYCGIIATKI
jgi:SAM-dependent methyltransferase